MTMILTSPLGVPFVMDGDTVIPVTHQNAGDIGVMLFENPSLADEIMDAIKAALALIIGIDPTLPEAEWHAEFSAAMTINEFVPAIQTLASARNLALSLQEANE